MEYNNYEQMTFSSLKNLARERRITRDSRLNKSELIKKLREPILDRGIDARMTNVPFLHFYTLRPPKSNSSTITLFKRC